MSTRHQGSTLLELLFALCMAWLLAQAALPGLLDLTAGNNHKIAAQAVLGALDRARSSSVILAKRIGVCMLAENHACAKEWRGDYLAVFIDENANRQRDDGEEIIFQQAWPAETTRLRWGGNWLNDPIISYQPNGSVVSNGTLYIEDAKGNVLHSLVISKPGRVRIESKPEADD